MLKDSFKKLNSWRHVSDEDIKTLVGTDGNRKRQRLNRKDLGEIIRRALKLWQVLIDIFFFVFVGICHTKLRMEDVKEFILF